jgi:hypothetical protein
MPEIFNILSFMAEMCNVQNTVHRIIWVKTVTILSSTFKLVGLGKISRNISLKFHVDSHVT